MSMQLTDYVDESHLLCLNRILESCAEGECLAQALHECGLPFEDEVARQKHHKSIAEKLKAKFFPSKP